MRKLMVLVLLAACLMCVLAAAHAEAELPQVRLTAMDGDILALNDKTVKQAIKVTYVEDGVELFNFPATIRLQGTTSLYYPKKNYYIEFYQDMNFSRPIDVDLGQGWGAHAKYCLKANWIDSLQSRNIVSARLAAQMQAQYGDLFASAVNRGVVDGYPVEVYIEGEYHGLYTMNIPKSDWLFGVDAENGGLVMGAENYTSSSTTFEMDAPAVDGQDWSIEVGPASTDAEVKSAFAKLNELIAFVRDSSDEDFKAHFAEHMNLDAALNYVCFVNLTNAVDNVCKNMMLVTYDGQVWYPCLYDLDTTWGIWFSGEGTYTPYNLFPRDFGGSTSVLWNRLMACFPEELQQRYFELRATVLSDANIMAEFQAFADSIPEEAWARERAKWPEVPGQEFGLEQIASDLRLRGAYVDNEMRLLTPMAAVVYDDPNMLYQLPEILYSNDHVVLHTGVNLYGDEQDPNAQEFTLFLRFAADPAATAQQTVLSNRDADNNGLSVLTAGNGSTEHIVFYTGNDRYEALYDLSEDGKPVVAIRKLGNEYCVYVTNVDNRRVISDAAIPAAVENELVLGAKKYMKGDELLQYDYFTGTIFNCEIYGYAMTESEINAYMAALVGSAAAPVRLEAESVRNVYYAGENVVVSKAAVLRADGETSDVTGQTTVEPSVLKLGDKEVTVTYQEGGKTVSCVMPVKVKALPDERMLYALAETIHFDGSSFIDTGITLFGEENPNGQDYTIVLKYKNAPELAEMAGIVSNMDSDADRNGLFIATAADGSMAYTPVWVGHDQYEAVWNANGLEAATVVIVKSGDVVTVYENDMDMVRVITDATVAEPVSGNLLIGAGMFGHVPYGCYQGDVIKCDVYGVALDAAEVEQLLAK